MLTFVVIYKYIWSHSAVKHLTAGQEVIISICLLLSAPVDSPRPPSAQNHVACLSKPPVTTSPCPGPTVTSQHSPGATERGQHSPGATERGQHSPGATKRGQHGPGATERGQIGRASCRERA